MKQFITGQTEIFMTLTVVSCDVLHKFRNKISSQ